MIVLKRKPKESRIARNCAVAKELKKKEEQRMAFTAGQRVRMLQQCRKMACCPATGMDQAATASKETTGGEVPAVAANPVSAEEPVAKINNSNPAEARTSDASSGETNATVSGQGTPAKTTPVVTGESPSDNASARTSNGNVQQGQKTSGSSSLVASGAKQGETSNAEVERLTTSQQRC